MKATDVFCWFVICGAIAIVFIMFLWAISDIGKIITKGRRILKRRPKRRCKAAGHGKTPKVAIDTRNCRWQQSERR